MYKKKKKIHPAATDSHPYFFFFLPFLLLSHFFLPADKESVGVGLAVTHDQPLRVILCGANNHLLQR
jgi:hypothetical protein